VIIFVVIMPWLWGGGCGVRILAGRRDFSLLQLALGGPLCFLFSGYRVSLPGRKAAGV